MRLPARRGNAILADTAVRESEETGSGRQLDLMEHLTELRTRLIRSIVYLLIGAACGWVFYDRLYSIVSGPVIKFLEEMGSKFILTGLTEGFHIKMQMSLVFGAILAAPLLTLEGWGFISPGLTRKERFAIRVIAPLSVVLFFGGVMCAWFCMPMGIKWLVAQNPPSATFMPSVGPSLVFIMKLYLAFGLVFQMPVVLMFLGKVGIVDSRMLKAYWRQAVVAIAVTAAAVTPSGDAFTMMMMCVPMVGLYGLSIVLVKIVERRR